MFYNRSLFWIVVFLMMAMPVYAAPEIPGAACSIEGKIESISKRFEEYKDDAWRKSWGLPKGVDYTDIRLILNKSSLVESGGGGQTCSLERLSQLTFQLQQDEKIHLEVGDTIMAMTKFSGDEFVVGQWLYDIKIK